MNDSVKQTIFVSAIIHNEKQQVLLVRRSLNDKFLPGYLELPGGRVELGESPERALSRKLTKELGITTSNFQYYGSISHIDSKGPYTRLVFEVAYNFQEPLVLTGAHDEVIWIGNRQERDTKLTADAKTIIDRYMGSAKEMHDDKKTTLIINTDGGSRGNPGPSAAAYVIYDGSGSKVLESGGTYIGITTNNQAEYTAVELALRAATRFASKDDTLMFNIDSLLVVNQLNGIYKVKNRELWPINQEIRELIGNFASVRFTHVPREQNVAADSKVNEILNQHML